MPINDMNLEEVNARLAEISEEVETRSGEELEGLKAEVVELQTRKAELEEFEKRQSIAEALRNGEAEADKVIEERKEIKPIMEERKLFTPDTAEYRSAFYAMLGGYATAEQRAILATPISVDGDGTNDGAAIAIPKTLDEKIWDNIHTAHPILADIATIRSGVVMEVTRHTAITNRATKKNDGASGPSDQTNTFVKVTLAGKDYPTYTELTYAEAKMSQGALEDYLAEEISAELGEALANDVFAQILSDAGNGQKVTPDASTPDLFGDLKKALALATMGGAKVVYAPSAKYYEIIGAINTNGGNPFNMAATLGVECKLDEAATKVTVLAPKMFILNEVQGTMIESDKDIKNHKIVVSGYNRSQGTLRKTKAAAYIN